jgi:hypothetical protein
VCGRTLLRGERAEVYLDGATRHAVCELCTSRALHGGWVREGTAPAYDDSRARVDRRRSLLSRWRGRREEPADAAEPDYDYDYDYEDRLSYPPTGPPAPGPEPADEPVRRGRPASRPAPAPAPRRRARPAANAGGRAAPGGREPRHVRAVPTSIEHKIASAVSLFNNSEHPRTVAGIARSLGLPDIAVHPSDATGSVVRVVVSWELCWYRYEVDLSDEVPSVRVAAQGYELDELSVLDRELNATADDRGVLGLA